MLTRSISMTIYTGNNYRKIYELHQGPIPTDEFGRTYDIHHVDGNRKNNHPSNLIAVTKQEHYNIHEKQGDWAACQAILSHLELTPEEISQKATEFNNHRVEEGTHPFLGGELQRKLIESGTHPFLRPDFQRNIQLNKIKEGRHHFVGGKLQRKNSLKHIAEGTHNFITNHPTKIMVTCPHCGVTGDKPNMKKYHFDKCPTTGYVKNTITCPNCKKKLERLDNYRRWHGENCSALKKP
jgi:hypothetical protein